MTYIPQMTGGKKQRDVRWSVRMRTLLYVARCMYLTLIITARADRASKPWETDRHRNSQAPLEDACRFTHVHSAWWMSSADKTTGLGPVRVRVLQYAQGLGPRATCHRYQSSVSNADLSPKMTLTLPVRSH